MVCLDQCLASVVFLDQNVHKVFRTEDDKIVLANHAFAETLSYVSLVVFGKYISETVYQKLISVRFMNTLFRKLH